MFKNVTNKQDVHNVIVGMSMDDRQKAYNAFKAVDDLHGLDMQAEYIMRTLQAYCVTSSIN